MFQIKFSCCCCKTYISLCTWGKVRTWSLFTVCLERKYQNWNRM